MVPLEKSKTSSESNFRMLSAFSHLFTPSCALLQMSGIKLDQLVPHSNLTIEIRVALSFVNKKVLLWFSVLIVSGRLVTRETIKFLIELFVLSSSRFHRTCKQKRKDKFRGGQTREYILINQIFNTLKYFISDLIEL